MSVVAYKQYCSMHIKISVQHRSEEQEENFAPLGSILDGILGVISSAQLKGAIFMHSGMMCSG